jgi:RNA polymerase primary sigma factor
MRQLKITKKITNRETQSLDKYLSEIAKVSLITAEEEAELARRIRKGDTAALDKLVKANLRFVVSVAKQYQNGTLTLSDLINEGNLGLIKAAGRFDETRGFKFISYAVWWIRQTIMQAMAEQSRMVRLPLNRVGSLNKISKTMSDLEQLYQREPTSEEIATVLDITAEDVELLASQRSRCLSMDAPISSDSDAGSLLELIPDQTSENPDSELMKTSMKTEVKRALSTLSTREAEVLSLYYGLSGGHAASLVEIGEAFNLTRERVRQIKEKATHKLRHSSKSKILATFL